ncbi:MAG: beta-ketoacyl-[acyl-carrier-protein] synthase family protein [Planctomycetaceae bacterium]
MNTSDAVVPRVVITGLGVFSPIGIGRDEFQQAVLAGESGVGVLELMDYSGLPGNVGAEVPTFTLATARKEFLKPQRKSVKVMCRAIQLGVASAMLALEDSLLDPETIDHGRLGVEFGADQMFSHPEALFPAASMAAEGDDHVFKLERWGETGIRGMEPLWLLKYLPNMPACHIGIAADARGPNNSLTQAEASGNLAIGEAFRLITRGSADIMISGSTGSRLHPIKCVHAAMWEELAQENGDPTTWYRPFDARRSGQVIGEGACSLILETEAHAKARGARILGTILGAGSSCVADRPGIPNHRLAIANAIRAALSDAGIQPGDVGHIHAHGLGTRDSDIEEAAAIRDVFGEAADIPVTAMKSALGNSGAGGGTLELAASLLALEKGVVPRTLNYEQPDPECQLDVVHGEPRHVSNPIVVNISATSNGQASVLVASA